MSSLPIRIKKFLPIALAASCIPFAQAESITSLKQHNYSQRVTSIITVGRSDLEQEIEISKPLSTGQDSSNCDLFNDPRSFNCLGASQTYKAQNNVERLIQASATYGARFVPMLNKGAKGSEYAKVIKNDGKAFLISGINSSGNNFINKQIQKTPFLAQTSIAINAGGSDTSAGFSIDSLMKLKEISHDRGGDLSTLLFSQARFTTSGISNGSTTNFGLGIRNRPNDNSMLGANVFWDYRMLDYSSAHSRLGLGAEYLWKHFELRNNWYVALTDSKDVNRGGADYTERVVPGWDVEIGYRLPQYPQLSFFIRGFHWDYEDTQDNDGAEASLNWQATPHLNVEAWVSNEISPIDINANSALPGTDETFVGVRMKLTTEPVKFNKKNFKKNMVTQMTQPVRRRYDVLLERSSGGFKNRAKSS